MQLTGSAFTPECQQINTSQRAHVCLTREADSWAKGRDEQEKEKERPEGALGRLPEIPPARSAGWEVTYTVGSVSCSFSDQTQGMRGRASHHSTGWKTSACCAQGNADVFQGTIFSQKAAKHPTPWRDSWGIPLLPAEGKGTSADCS